jgi:hypothetical protein
VTHVNGSTVPAVLEISRKVYATSLVLYPGELRREFGAEMVDVFDEQVSEAFFRRGFSGLLHVWFSTAREFVTVALPGRFAEHMVPIVGVTATLAFMVWFAGYVGYVMQTACSGCGH